MNMTDRNMTFIMKVREQTTRKSNTKNIVIGFMVIVIVNNLERTTYE
jgi:hypothetical protein